MALISADELFHITYVLFAIQHDSNMGLFLLPHALIHALLDSSTKDVSDIRQEILTIMEDIEKGSVHEASGKIKLHSHFNDVI